MSEPLPPFSGDEPTCSKCGHEGASTEYRALGKCLHDSGEAIGANKNERLHRECSRCNHAWDEAIVTTEAP